MPNEIRDLHTVDQDSYPYVFEQNATVPLKSSDGVVRVNVYRPKTDGKVPVLVTYAPYGKDIPYSEYENHLVVQRTQLMTSSASMQSHLRK